MKISIITICYNSEKTIKDTIESVLSQTYPDVEYIIIDGRSKDGTLDIVKKYSSQIAEIISEPDKGIYDAMNKGIKKATGEIIGIINSDDFYCNKDIIATVVNQFKKTGVDACYGNIQYIDRDNIEKKVRFWRAGEYRKEKLRSGWIMPHPAFFVKRSVYEKYGLFNLDFKIAADYELMLRFLLRHITLSYIDETLVSMREGGTSAASIKHRKKGWRELKRAWEVNHLDVPFLFIVRRVLSKVRQYVI